MYFFSLVTSNVVYTYIHYISVYQLCMPEHEDVKSEFIHFFIKNQLYFGLLVYNQLHF